jgi:phage terminase small subunit
MAETPQLTTTAPVVDDPFAKLRAKQRRFVEEFVIDHNATAAYQRAGYVATRVSAASNAYRLLRNAEIQAAIRQREEELTAELRLRQHEIHGVLRTVGLSSINDYTVDDQGNVTLANGVDPLAFRAIKSIKRRTKTITRNFATITTHEVELTLRDNLTAIRMAGQTQGMFTPKEEDPGAAKRQAEQDYYLTLIEIVQQRGIKSKEGAESFYHPPQPAIDVTPKGGGDKGTNGRGTA